MKYTPFYEKILADGGKMVEFSGYMMPVQFPNGIIFEHKAVRERAGLFDVSHMGEIMLKGSASLAFLQKICTNNMADMPIGRARYSPVTNFSGGIVDDILVYRMSEEVYMLVVNAGNAEKMVAWVNENLIAGADAEDISGKTAQLALQGPKAIDIISTIFESKDIPEKNYTFSVTRLFDSEVILSRTGYTGEDGFEIYCGKEIAERVYDLLKEKGEPFGMALCGLGARDTLRLEAAMPLYGHEMNEETKANEIGLNFFIKMDKEFNGKSALGIPKNKRIGLKLIDKGIARDGAEVYSGEEKIGMVTSGTHSPTLGYAIAMARVRADFDGGEVAVDVRGRRLKAEVTPLPFYKKSK